jgi:uncharacterized protein (TIGR02757 family)
MLMRWMGRRDEVDPGLWMSGSDLVPAGRGLLPRQLIMPLDTHVGRICQFLGLTRRKSLNWKAALEVTAGLAAEFPEDPVRHDFALARIGIVDRCRGRYIEAICTRCELFGPCRAGRPRLKGGRGVRRKA